MPRSYSSSKNVTSITYWRKFAEHRLVYIFLAFIFGFGIIAYFGMGPMGGGGGVDQRQRSQQQIVAIVNGEKISRGAYDSQWDRFKRRLGGGGNDVQAVSMQGMLLGNLIDTAIATSAAKKKGLTVSDADIDKQISDMKKGPDGKPIPEKQFEDQLALEGMTVNQVRDELKEGLLPKVLNDSFAAGIKVSEDLLTNEVKLRHVLISNTKLPDEQAKRKADQVYAEAKSGKDFAELANKFTDDPGNAAQPKFDPKTKKLDKGAPKGGLYDWAPASNYVPEFANTSVALKPGEISPPVKTDFGYHIIKLEGIRKNIPKDFEKNKAQLLSDLKNRYAQGVARKFLEEQKKTAKIVWEDPSLEWRYEYSKSNTGMPGTLSGGATAMVPKLKAYVAKNPDDSAAAMILGQQKYMQYAMSKPGPDRDKMRDEVIGYYETALKHSEDQQTRLTLAQLYHDAKKDSDALRHYTTLARLLKWDESAQSKYTHQQLEKAFKELGKPDLAEKETIRIAQLTAEEKKKADEMKKQQEEAKKKAEEDKKKKAEEDKNKKADNAKPDGSKPNPVVTSPGGTITINPPPASVGAKPNSSQDDRKPESPKPAEKK